MATSRVHVNENGEALPCEAPPGQCPIMGGEAIHASTVAEARQLYEESMADVTVTSRNRHGGDGDAGEKSWYDRTHFTIPGENLARAQASVDKANRRLAKAGIVERFELEATERLIPHEENGVKWAEQVYDITLNEPRLSYNGYEFQAVMSKEGDGFIMRSGREVEMGGWRPDSMYCEHCEHRRTRAKTYLIKDEDGNVSQIGSTCVQAYLGMKPEGLWALEYNLDDDLMGGGGGGGPMRMDNHRDVNNTLAIALAVSNGGDDFVPRSYGGYPTADAVNAVVFGGKGISNAWREEMMAKAAEYQKDGSVQRVKDAVGRMEGDSDYVANIKVLVGSEYTSPKSHALLVSAIGSMNREKREAAREAEKAAREAEKVKFRPGHMGEINDKVAKDTALNLVEVVPYSAIDFRGHDVTKYRVVMRDDDGHQVLYFASRKVKGDADGKIRLSSGVVKKHGSYEGIDQTVLSNVRPMKDYLDGADDD